ncbi:hypothetical protein ACWIGW_31800 [Nocardia brasiliensis]
MMSDFDRIYARVREINRDWARMTEGIRDGPTEPEHLTKIVCQHYGCEFGWVKVDATGSLRSIYLDRNETMGIREEDVVAALIAAVNSAIEKAISVDRRRQFP